MTRPISSGASGGNPSLLRRIETDTRIKQFESLPMVAGGRWPTPIHDHTLENGRRILVKRDDLSGIGRGGAKARKITYLVGHMEAARNKRLIAVAGNITNVVYDIIPLLEAKNIRGDFFIIDEPELPDSQRRELFTSVQKYVHLRGRSKIRIAFSGGIAFVGSVLRREKPLLVLPGITHPAAVAGNAAGFLEMARQLLEGGRPLPDCVYVTAATGATLAGFILAENLLRKIGAPPIPVIGVQIYEGRIDLLTRFALRWTERHYGIPSRERAPWDRINIDRSYLEGGFGHYSRATAELSRKCAFRIDPIFGGKTWSRFLDDLNNRASESRSTSTRERLPLFWHCGYTPGWEDIGREHP